MPNVVVSGEEGLPGGSCPGLLFVLNLLQLLALSMLCADNRIQPNCVQWCVDASPWWLISPALCIPHLPALETKQCFRGWQPSSVQSLGHVWLFATPWTAACQPPCPSPTPGVHPNPCPLSRWCHPIISSSVVPFSPGPQSFPASGSFQMSQLFTSGGQSIGVSASTSVLPMNIQDWSPSGWTGWISFQSKGLSRVFYNTTVQKHQFLGARLSL